MRRPSRICAHPPATCRNELCMPVPVPLPPPPPLLLLLLLLLLLSLLVALCSCLSSGVKASAALKKSLARGARPMRWKSTPWFQLQEARKSASLLGAREREGKVCVRESVCKLGVEQKRV